MSILHVRNVPQDLYLRLKQRAETQRRSLSAEVITLLEWAIEEVERASELSLESIRRRRFASVLYVWVLRIPLQAQNRFHFLFPMSRELRQNFLF